MPKFIGNILLFLATESTSFIRIDNGPITTIDNRSLPSKQSTYFFAFSLSIVIFITSAWILVFYMQKYRLNNIKYNLQVH